MMLTRRSILAAAALPLLPARAAAQGWYDLTGDDGKPVQNQRLPVELVADIARLPGLIRTSAGTPDIAIVEFTDFNCPFCRRSAVDMPRLAAANRDVGIAYVNNPILSQGSREAALIELAVLKLLGPMTAASFHQRMFSSPGKADRTKALAAARAIKLDPGAITEIAAPDPELDAALAMQMQLAERLSLGATPSFVVGTTGILGYPGAKAMQRVIDNLRRCDEIVCG